MLFYNAAYMWLPIWKSTNKEGLAFACKQKTLCGTGRNVCGCCLLPAEQHCTAWVSNAPSTGCQMHLGEAALPGLGLQQGYGVITSHQRFVCCGRALASPEPTDSTTGAHAFGAVTVKAMIPSDYCYGA